MNYDEFKESLRSMVSNGLGDEICVTLSSVSKNNGRMRDALVVTGKGSELSPSIYLEAFWNMFNKGESVENLARHIIRIYRETDLSGRVDLSMFFEFEKVKDNIVYKIINKEKNEALLCDVPHLDYLDLAVVFCYVFTGGELDGATILIHNSHTEMWGVDASDLMECADKNTRKIMGVKIGSLFDYLKKMLKSDALLPDEDLEDDGVPLYVLSNKRGLNGACAILYKGLLKSLYEQMESDFFVFPSSVHEVIIMPNEDMAGAEYFCQMVREINETELAKEDVLSDSVYYYSHEEDELKRLA